MGGPNGSRTFLKYYYYRLKSAFYMNQSTHCPSATVHLKFTLRPITGTLKGRA